MPLVFEAFDNVEFNNESSSFAVALTSNFWFVLNYVYVNVYTTYVYHYTKEIIEMFEHNVRVVFDIRN